MSPVRTALLALCLALAACESLVPPGAAPSPAGPGSYELVVRAIGPAGFVPGASVCVASPGSREERCATTDRAGAAPFTLRAGTYVIRGTPPEGARLRQGVATLELAAPGEATVVLEGLARITGTVSDPDGKPALAAEVCAYPTDRGAVVCARSGAGGAYAVEVRPVPHRLHFDGPGDGSRLLSQWAYGRVATFEAEVIDLRGGDAKGIDVTLRRGITLSGVVTAERTGRPVEDAQVCMQTLAEPLPWDCERTDKEGRYAALREPGRYWVWTIPPGFDPKDLFEPSRLVYQRYDRVEIGVDATPFVLTSDRRYDVALWERHLIHGRLTLPDGSPVGQALVCVDTPFPTGRICRESDTNGVYYVATRNESYALQVIPPPGSEAVSEWWPRGRDWTDSGRVRVAGADVRIDVVLRRGERVTGVVRTEEGVPVEAAPVSFNDAGGFLVGTYTDGSGHYDIAVPPGSYRVDIFAPRVSELISVVGAPLQVFGETGFDVVLPFARP